MAPNTDHLEHARRVADAVLYEGYLLYPYHQAAQKNQARFQFGVLMPPAYAALDAHEPSSSQTECLLECGDDAEVSLLTRFLHVHRRTVQAASPWDGALQDVQSIDVAGEHYTAWDEAAEREQRVAVSVTSLLSHEAVAEFHIDAGETTQELTGPGGVTVGRLAWQWQSLNGAIRVHAERVCGPFQALKLRVVVENRTTPPGGMQARPDALPFALIAAHTLIHVPGARFLSMTDPPEWAAAEVRACRNGGTWPVLCGPAECSELMLSSPVILYDHPEVAAESQGDLFDATEIDEILTLRTLALTDAEKLQARATDNRAAALLDRLDDMPPEMLERMHGAIRYLRSAPAGTGLAGRAGLPASPGSAGPSADEVCWPAPSVTDRPSVPWWDPGSDASVSPETDHVLVSGKRVARGSRVIMQPGARRADAQDLFLAGREAIVESVLHDVDGQVHLAVTPADDPAADLQRSHGRFLYFAPDEITPL
jgi:hypothetical protein